MPSRLALDRRCAMLDRAGDRAPGYAGILPASALNRTGASPGLDLGRRSWVRGRLARIKSRRGQPRTRSGGGAPTQAGPSAWPRTPERCSVHPPARRHDQPGHCGRIQRRTDRCPCRCSHRGDRRPRRAAHCTHSGIRTSWRDQHRIAPRAALLHRQAPRLAQESWVARTASDTTGPCRAQPRHKASLTQPSCPHSAGSVHVQHC